MVAPKIESSNVGASDSWFVNMGLECFVIKKLTVIFIKINVKKDN
jgi:hypothetical protein